MDISTDDIRLIYSRLSDTVSKEIFVNRLAYGMTGDLGSLRRMIGTFSVGKEFIEKLNQAVSAKMKLCIFGAGIWGKCIVDSYPDVDFQCFVDNDLNKSKVYRGGGIC